MNKVTRIVILSLCTALTLSSCSKKHHQPEEPQKTLLEFTAVSQNAAQKAILPESSLARYHKDFGVWGIARQDGNDTPYVLWSSDAMAEVYAGIESDYTSEEDKYTGTFIPREDAYWLADFTYKFIAVAPYESVASGVTIDEDACSVSFDCDLSSRYSAQNHAFDLLGAVAEHYVDPTASRPSSQNLVFWHLFSKITTTVEFIGATGQVNEMRLHSIDTKADYTLSFDSDMALDVACESDSENSQTSVSFDGIAESGNVLLIIPQNISDFRMFLDFTITADGQSVPVNNFEVNLSKAKESPDYAYNESYNWIIKISPKGVAFDVELAPWVDAEGDFEFDLQ